MEFCWFLRSVTFVVRSLGRFLGLDVCLWLSGVAVAAFFEKLTHFLTFVVKVGVVTTKAPYSKKLREWNGIFWRVRMGVTRKHLTLKVFLL